MFAPKVAKPQTKTIASSTNSLARQRSAFLAHPPRHAALEQARSIGNQATLRLLAQRGFSPTGEMVGGDLEQEAHPASPTVQAVKPSPSWDFSKIPIFPPERPNRPHAPSSFAPPPQPGIQRNLVVGQVNDPLEQEADRVADQVMRMPAPEVSVSAAAPQLSRRCAACQQDDRNEAREMTGPRQFGRKLAFAQRPQSSNGMAPDLALAQNGSPDGQDGLTATQDGGVGTVSTPSGAATAPCCQFDSFSASNDSYVDTANTSTKYIKFAVNMKPGADPHSCALVGWSSGFAKHSDGSFFQTYLSGKLVDFNFPTPVLDTIGVDPVWWSTASSRWNYDITSVGGGSGTGTGLAFSASDQPGPSDSVSGVPGYWLDGEAWDVKQNMCLYCIKDVSLTSDASGSGVKNPLSCYSWVFKAKYDAATKTFTH